VSEWLTEAFVRYLGRIELNADREKLASTRYNAVKTVLEGALPGVTVREIGSFQRHTKIRPLDLGDGLDVDVVVALGTATHYAGAGEFGLRPGGAQEKLLRALQSTAVYRVMKPQKDAPTVLLEYSDRDRFTIELVPAFIEKTGKYPRPAGPACYIIAGSAGVWVPADYDYDAAVITGLNKSDAVQGTLVPLIKMAKAYFRAMELGVPILLRRSGRRAAGPFDVDGVGGQEPALGLQARVRGIPGTAPDRDESTHRSPGQLLPANGFRHSPASP
jgi:hypothetical protein